MLQAIRFNDPSELNQFILYLEDQNLISIEDKEGTHQIQFITEANCFLKAKNGDTYLLEAVQKFVDEASDADIKEFADTFLTKEGQEVTLAQLKAQPELFNQLLGDAEFISLLKLLNPSWYENIGQLKFANVEDIEALKALFSNEKLVRNIKFGTSLFNIISSLESINSTPGEDSFSVIELEFFDQKIVTRKILVDILKLSLLQELTLKFHLLEELKNSRTIEIKQAINEWVQATDDNIQSAKSFLNHSLKLLAKKQASVKTAIGRYELLTEDGFSQESAKLEIEKLQAAIAIKEKKIESKASLLDTLKPVVFFSVALGLPLLTIGLILLMVGLFATPAALAITGSVIALLLGSLLFDAVANKIADSIFKPVDKIINYFTDKSENEQKDIVQMQKQVFHLEQDIKLVNDFAINREIYEFVANDYESSMAEIDTCLQAVADVEQPFFEPVAPKVEGTLSAKASGSVGFFKDAGQVEKKEEEPAPVACVI